MTITQLRPAVPPRPAAVPPATPSWWRPALLASLVLAVVSVVVLWASHAGVSALQDGPAAALTTTGRLLGLLASLLMLVQVLLMARVPALERSFGQDGLARAHRWVGFGSFALLLGHVALVTQGYALADGRNPVGEIWRLTLDYPGVLLAVAGTGMLVLVVATSLRRARRRLRYESWHLLHLYSYLGAGLVLPHQLWTGADFLVSPAVTLLWWSAWGATAAMVLTYRIGLPLTRSLRHQLVVEAVVPEAPGVVSLHLRGRRLDRLHARSGQFFLWRFLGAPGRTRAHPYSLSAVPSAGMLRITVKDLGDDSGWVHAVRRGSRVALEGPYGRLTSERSTGRPALLLACGVGVTPLRALAEELTAAGRDVVLLHRLRTSSDALFADELLALRSAGLRTVHLTGPRQEAGGFLPGPDGDVAALRRAVPDVSRRDVFVCGPPAWAVAARAAVQAAGVPRRRVHEERFAW